MGEGLLGEWQNAQQAQPPRLPHCSGQGLPGPQLREPFRFIKFIVFSIMQRKHQTCSLKYKNKQNQESTLSAWLWLCGRYAGLCYLCIRCLL